MIPLASLLLVVHLIGLALAVGAATVKLVLLLKCRADHAFVPVFLKVARPITRQIILGLVLLTLSGIGWLMAGYQFSARLTVKVMLVAAIWVLGPIIDNLVEPKFRSLAPAPGEPWSPAFMRAEKQYLTLEVVATLLFYIIIVMWAGG
jgi:hypothetical protein